MVFQSASAWQGWLAADSRLLVAQARHQPEPGLGDIRLQILSLRERPQAQRVAVRGEHGDGFAYVFRRRAVHDRARARLDVPGALSRRHDERRAAETQHAGLEGGERSQRWVHEQQAEDPARQRARLRPGVEPAREVDQVDDLFAREVCKVEKALHQGD